MTGRPGRGVSMIYGPDDMPLAEFLDGSEEGVDLNLSKIGQAKGALRLQGACNRFLRLRLRFFCPTFIGQSLGSFLLLCCHRVMLLVGLVTSARRTGRIGRGITIHYSLVGPGQCTSHIQRKVSVTLKPSSIGPI